MSAFPTPDTRQLPPPTGSVVSWPLKVLGALVGLMFLFLGVGWALPATWSVERSRYVDATPGQVFAWVDAPASWRAWTAWPDVVLEGEGPERGAGATVRWDDPTWGRGEFAITASTAPREVSYAVQVEDGALVTRGRMVLEVEGVGTRVTWRESGDFGWNPLMGYAALGMDRMQGAEMEKGLARLDSVAGGSAVGSRPPG